VEADALQGGMIIYDLKGKIHQAEQAGIVGIGRCKREGKWEGRRDV